MKFVVGVIAAVAACVVPPAQQQSQTYPPQQPYPQQGQQYAAAPTATCQDTLNCYGQCNPLTEQCIGGCDQRTSPESQQNAHAVLQCIAQSGCQDQACIAQSCNGQIQTCTSMTLAVQQPQPAPSNGPDQTMQPQYYAGGGGLIVPPPQRMIQQSDLAGEWKGGDGAVSNYASSNGQYAGFRSISMSEAWTIDAQGNFTEDFKAARSGIGGTSGFEQHNTGTVTANGNNTITFNFPAQSGRAAYFESYIIVGWFVGPEVVFMKLQGPFRQAITQQDFNNIQSNQYLNHTYMRKR